MKLIVTTFFIFFALICNAQRHKIYEYEDLTDDIVKNYFHALTMENSWRPFVSNLEDLSFDMEQDLKAESGLSFDDMNHVRILKAKLRKMKEFGYGVANGSYINTFNGRMFREIKEVFPEITMELLNENSCVSFYRIKILSHVIVAARHNEQGVVKEISYWDQSKKCGSIAFGGTITVYPGIYRTFWQNTKCPSYNGYGIFIKSCKFERSWDTSFEPVKSFEEY